MYLFFYLVKCEKKAYQVNVWLVAFILDKA